MATTFRPFRVNKMKRLTAFCIIFIILLCHLPGHAQALLWQISKPGHRTCYIMGTIHLTDNDIQHVNDTVWSCMRQCSLLALELDLHQADNIMEHITMKKATMDQLLTPEEYHVLDSIMRKKTRIGMSFFNRMQPLFFYSVVMMDKKYGIAMDLLLQHHADSLGIATMGMESVKDQVKAFKSISLEQQAKGLAEMLHNLGKTGELDSLMLLYKRQDIKGLEQMIQNDPSSTKALIEHRNQGFVKHIKKLSPSKSVFFAVGAGHLEGKQGILNLLRKHRYTLQAISIYPSPETEISH
ncbi:MAG: TraB/GumN family protein [Bacteroidales bacterium]|nr:TraB/GumN family protein [Bacteroidales bacterium]